MVYSGTSLFQTNISVLNTGVSSFQGVDHLCFEVWIYYIGLLVLSNCWSWFFVHVLFTLGIFSFSLVSPNRLQLFWSSNDIITSNIDGILYWHSRQTSSYWRIQLFCSQATFRRPTDWFYMICFLKFWNVF